MNRRLPVLALFAAFSLAACSTDVVAPLKAPSAPRLAMSSAASSGNYLVVMQGSGIPQGFMQAVANLGGSVTSSHADAGFATVSGLTDATAAQLASTSGISEVDPDAAVGLDAPVSMVQADAAALTASPSIDSQSNPASAILASWQWNMRLIGADKAWAAHKLGRSTVTVAILDTGLDYDNRDLTGLVDLSRSVSFMNTWVGPAGGTPTASDDQITTTLFPTRNKISDYNGHGTNVGATVSSKAFAFGGVTSRTTLIGVKVLGANGFGSFSSILNGVLWAVDHGADVANMSLGGEFAKAGNGRAIGAINKVFNYASKKGMLIVVAAGNASEDLQHNGNTFASYCDAPHVLCVSAVGPTTVNGNPDTPAFYTNFGKNSVDVAAPGGNADIVNFPISAWPWGNDFASWVWSFCSRTSLKFSATGTPSLAGCQAGNRLNGYIGTSQATPHATGLAALLVADNGKAKPDQIKKMIQKSGDPIDRVYGRSRISVKNALGL